jgi:hypothetical protein
MSWSNAAWSCTAVGLKSPDAFHFPFDIVSMTFEQKNVRTPTHLWLEAKIRELNDAGTPAYILNRGEKMDGMVVFKISDCAGTCRLLTQQRNLDGEMEWVDAVGEERVAEDKADAYIERSLKRDPDLWAVEIEDRSLGTKFLT